MTVHSTGVTHTVKYPKVYVGIGHLDQVCARACDAGLLSDAVRLTCTANADRDRDRVGHFLRSLLNRNSINKAAVQGPDSTFRGRVYTLYTPASIPLYTD